MHNHDNQTHTHFSKLFHLKDKLGLLYSHIVIQSFAISLISVFVPIYLLTIDFTLSQVFLYLLVEWTLFGLLAPLYGKIIHKLGLKEIILIRTPFLIIGLMLLFSLETSTLIRNYYLIIPIIMGASGALYTLSISSLFAKYMGNKKQTEKTAKFMSYPRIFAIASPTIGAIIASYFGFSFLLTLVSIFLFISVFPIFLIKQKISHPKFNLKVFKEIKLELKEFLLLMAYGITGLVFSLILPITLYLYSSNIISLGIFISAISLISAIFTIYLGKLANRHGYTKILKIGALLTFVLLMLIGYFLKSEYIIHLSLISGFVNILINLPYETHLYKKSREHKSHLEFLVFKEFSLYFGRIFLFGILILFFSNIEFSYYLGAFASLAFLLF